MKKKKLWIALLVAFVVLAASVVYLNRAVIFQRGNPIPYLTAAARISEKNPYVAVDEAKGIYISKRGECPELLEYYQEKTGRSCSQSMTFTLLLSTMAWTAPRVIMSSLLFGTSSRTSPIRER